MSPPVQWPASHREVPAIFPAESFGPSTGTATGTGTALEPFFFRGAEWRDTETRVFGWIGLPPNLAPGETCPGMVLLHGGGGTAFDVWVQKWNERGYAAITFDQCGDVPAAVPANDGAVHHRHEHSGPPGWDSSFRTVNEPIEDQWPFHAVAAALRAHSLLAAHPLVDAGRIGLTGISWGGYLTSVVSGVDERYRFSAPVYGCGFLHENSVWSNPGPGLVDTEGHRAVSLKTRGDFATADGKRWAELWDPSRYLPSAELPMLWLNGTNDFAYPLDSYQKSYSCTPGYNSLCIRVEMPHSHADGWAPEEIGRFADWLLCDGPPLPTIHASHCTDDGGELCCEVVLRGGGEIAAAELCYTRAEGSWPDRKYNRLPIAAESIVRLGEGGGSRYRVSAPVPCACIAFLTVEDAEGSLVSTPHVDTWGMPKWTAKL